MSVCKQAMSRRSRARVNRPKGLRGQSRSSRSLMVDAGFGGKISKTAKKSAGK